MKRFMSVTFVQAREMSESEAFHKGLLRSKNSELNRAGFLVKYDNDYKAWMPKNEFVERFGEPVDLPFSVAIEALKDGKKISRKGWNGKDMFLWMKPSAMVESAWCKDSELKALVDANGGTMEALPTICMKTADGKILTGWVASQSDIFAEDWFVLTD